MNDEQIVATGRIFELVHIPQADGRFFEVARRAPGVRVLIVDDANKKVLLTKEYRNELQDWDFRLPGGKVLDSLAEYETFRKSGKDIVEAAKAKAKAEAAEEAGMQVDDLKFVKKSTLGATVEWDLYVFKATTWALHQDGQRLEAGEQVDAVEWYGFAEVERMILSGAMQEERIALIVLQWLQTIKT